MGRPRIHDEETRADLLASAESLITEGGPDALTVRGVADRSGTTTRAVYSIFGSKEGLVAAMAEVAFDWLYRRVEEIPETEEPFRDLTRIGLEVFRRFITEHPGLYRIAFQRIVELKPQPGLTDARERAFVQLQERVRRAKEIGLLGEKSVLDATVELIAMFEGLANAELREQVLPTMTPGEEERAWSEGLATLLRGFESFGQTTM